MLNRIESKKSIRIESNRNFFRPNWNALPDSRSRASAIKRASQTFVPFCSIIFSLIVVYDNYADTPPPYNCSASLSRDTNSKLKIEMRQSFQKLDHLHVRRQLNRREWAQRTRSPPRPTGTTDMYKLFAASGCFLVGNKPTFNWPRIFVHSFAHRLNPRNRCKCG